MSADEGQAQLKRSGMQCGKAAMRGKSVCRAHGGLSSGIKAEESRKRFAEANYVRTWKNYT